MYFFIFISMCITLLISLRVGSIDAEHNLMMSIKNPFYIAVGYLGTPFIPIFKYPNFAVVFGLIGILYETIKYFVKKKK